MKYLLSRTVIPLALAALAVASCDKLKPPSKLPLPQMDPQPRAEQPPAPKAHDPGASQVRPSSLSAEARP